MVGSNCNWLGIYVTGCRGIKTFTFPPTTHRKWHTAWSCNSWWRAPKQIRLAKKSGHRKVEWTSLSATSIICTGRHLIELSSFQEENWLRSYFSRGELVAIIFFPSGRARDSWRRGCGASTLCLGCTRFDLQHLPLLWRISQFLLWLLYFDSQILIGWSEWWEKCGDGRFL